MIHYKLLLIFSIKQPPRAIILKFSPAEAFGVIKHQILRFFIASFSQICDYGELFTLKTHVRDFMTFLSSSKK